MQWDSFRDCAWRYGVGSWLRFLAEDELQLLRRARAVVSVAIILGLGALAYAIVLSPTPFKSVNIAGLLFDIAGALRIFVMDDVDKYLEPFKDKKEYPYGPPSVAMRELIMPEASPYADEEVPHIQHALFYKRGVLYLLFGFLLQLIAAVFG